MSHAHYIVPGSKGRTWAGYVDLAPPHLLSLCAFGFEQITCLSGLSVMSTQKITEGQGQCRSGNDATRSIPNMVPE